MKRLQVRILPRAEKDFRVIHAYLKKHSLIGSARWRLAFEAQLNKASRNPEHYAQAQENDLTEFELRECFFKTRRGLRYRLVFTVHENELLILRIRGPGQPALAEDELPLLLSKP